MMTVQIVEISGQKMAILPIADYERLIDIVEDKADAAAAVDAEQRRRGGEEYLPMAMVNRILGGENALKVWREYRGFSGVQLAEKASMSPTTISKLEKGHRQGSRAIWRALASALNVTPDDILPAD